MGLIARKLWIEIPQHFNHIVTDEFIIMPNHIHGILIINNNPTVFYRGTACRAPINDRSPVEYGAFRQELFGKPCKGSIPTVIRSYKSAVTRLCRKEDNKYFGWQRNYYMRLIINDKELFAARKYIIDNPKNWNYK
jgi:REP element-mobilizing transposase RayT